MSGEGSAETFAVLEVSALPDLPLDASRAFYDEYLADACAMVEHDGIRVLTIQLPMAGKDHDDWRRTLARDLARKYAPARVNVIAASEGGAGGVLDYLLRAPGVTGQYLPTDD